MSELILLKPTEADIAWWIDHFVPELMLWWWDDSPIPKVSEAERVIERADRKSDPVIGEIAYVNAFHSWAMHKDVERIIVDDGRWISTLPDDEHQRASRLQVNLNRGLCIPRARFGDDPSIPEAAMFDGRVVIDHALWAALSRSSKRLVIKSELADWDRESAYPVPLGTAPHISEIANAFVQQEGVNCLSVTAFAITQKCDDLHQWMFPEEISDVLNEAGYAVTEDTIPQADDVILFRDHEGTIVHAAYAIQPDRILNKNGQSSFNPIAIIDLASLLEDWSDYTLSTCRR